MGVGVVLPKPLPSLLSHGEERNSEKPHLPTDYMAAYNLAHPFLSFPGGFYCSHWERLSLRVALPLGLWEKIALNVMMMSSLLKSSSVWEILNSPTMDPSPLY